MLVKQSLCFLLLPKKQLDSVLKIKGKGKELHETDSVKYLGTQIDKRFTWKQKVNHPAIKLNKANAMLSKLGHVLDKKALKSFYYAIFESHLCYASLFWAQNTNSVKIFHLLQKQSLQIMFFQSSHSQTGSSSKCSKFLSPLTKLLLKTAFH